MYVTVIYAIHTRILFIPHDVPIYESDLSEKKSLTTESRKFIVTSVTCLCFPSSFSCIRSVRSPRASYSAGSKHAL